MKGEIHLEGPSGADYLRLEAEHPDEIDIIKGLYQTIKDADDCVLIAKGKEIVVYGGAFSGKERGQLRDLLGMLLSEMHQQGL